MADDAPATGNSTRLLSADHMSRFRATYPSDLEKIGQLEAEPIRFP